MWPGGQVCTWRSGYGEPVIGPFIGLDAYGRPCIAGKQDPDPSLGWTMGPSSCMEAISAEEVALLQLDGLDGL